MKNTISNTMSKATILFNYMEADLWFYSFARPGVADYRSIGIYEIDVKQCAPWLRTGRMLVSVARGTDAAQLQSSSTSTQTDSGTGSLWVARSFALIRRPLPRASALSFSNCALLWNCAPVRKWQG
jgi:hypothetical protein